MKNKRLVQALWYEPTTEFLSSAYKAGFARNFLTCIKSLLSRDNELIELLNSATRSDRVAFCFFKNEINSAAKHREVINWTVGLTIKQQSLGFLLSYLGWKEVVIASALFISDSIKFFGLKGTQYFAHPLLAYLLYIFLRKEFENIKPESVIVFNLLHPLSVAVANAAKDSGIIVEYCEHAATTRLMLNNIYDYRRLWVMHSHTKEMLVQHGIPRSSVEAFCPELTKARLPDVVRSIGVCINDLDGIDDILSLAHYLSRKDVRARYRIHDADKRYGKLKRFLTDLGHTVESARSSSISKYFDGISLLIAGNSNVIGDAIEHTVPVIYIWFGDCRLDDYYGYVNAYNLDYAYNMSELFGMLDGIVLESAEIL